MHETVYSGVFSRGSNLRETRTMLSTAAAEHSSSSSSSSSGGGGGGGGGTAFFNHTYCVNILYKVPRRDVPGGVAQKLTKNRPN